MVRLNWTETFSHHGCGVRLEIKENAKPTNRKTLTHDFDPLIEVEWFGEYGQGKKCTTRRNGRRILDATTIQPS